MHFEPGERDVPMPLAQLGGPSDSPRKYLPPVIALAAIGMALVAAPFLPHLLKQLKLGPNVVPRGVAVAFGVLASLGVGFLGYRWADARSGRAEIFEDRVSLQRGTGAVDTVFFKDLDGFDDGSVDFVKVVAGGRSWPIPTPTERGRSLVLETLTDADVPRLEPGATRTTRARSPVGPRLVVTGWSGKLELGVMVGTFFVAGLLGASAAETLSLPWLDRLAKLVFVLGGGPRWLALMIPWYCVALWLAPRRGEVRFHDDRITFSPRWSLVRAPATPLSWDDVVGWRDASPSYVVLVPRPGFLRDGPREPTVPTLTAAAREGVFALLRARGLPQLAPQRPGRP